ncbi:Prefoldin chaperone subunit family protein [Zea mays]|uniref:Prefoldin chaperone subunit family protein n=1 Tax=Zea mays TaxID=4577 RepID=A0A1D6G510_MAIZE|nr:Prefoldin chaperone subunit family protein [Zea mays]
MFPPLNLLWLVRWQNLVLVLLQGPCQGSRCRKEGGESGHSGGPLVSDRLHLEHVQIVCAV